MASTVDEFGKKLNGGTSFVLPHEMLSTEFYLRPPVSDGFKKLQWDISLIDREHLSVDPVNEVGITARTLPCTIKLYKTGGRLYATLFAKVFHPSRHTHSGYREPRSLDEKVTYEVRNLQYWNLLGLPSPLYLATVECPAEVSSQENSQTVLMTHVGAPTHDLDILAIHQQIEIYQQVFSDNFREPTIRAHARNNIHLLETEKRRIINSMLESHIRTQLLGTYHLKLAEKKLKLTVFQPSDPLEDELKKTAHYLQYVWLRELVDMGKISLENAHSILQDGKPLPFQDEFRITLLNPFQELTRPLFTSLHHLGHMRYAQGDEFPWHYAYNPIHDDPSVSLAKLRGERINKHSAMFDANNAKMALPEDGITNILFNSLVHLTDDEIENAAQFYFRTLPKSARFYSRKSLRVNGSSVSQEDINSLVPHQSFEELFTRLQLYALLRAPVYHGLKSLDQLDQKSHTASLEHRNRVYDIANSLIQFPPQIPNLPQNPTHVQYKPFSPTHGIPILKEIFQRTFNSFLTRSHSLNSQSLDLVKRLQDLYRANGLI